MEKDFFREGEWILDKKGIMYYVMEVCKCDYCEEEGFYEPTLVVYDGKNVPNVEYLLTLEALHFIENIKTRSLCKNDDWIQEILENHRVIIKNSVSKLISEFIEED